MENEFGTIDILIDELVPCLKDNVTGTVKETVVYKVETKNLLKDFNEKNGWYINWKEIPKGVEVYALALKEDNSIQGLVGIKKDEDARAVYIHWAVVAPWNNKQKCENIKYIGVGGHLFAIAIDKSYSFGYNGVVYGFASNEYVLKHYIEKLNATYLGILHKFQFAILEKEAKKSRRYMIMNGIKKAECFSGIKETEFYNKEINPYELPPKSNFNIGALSEYLIKTGKNIYSLTKDEAEQFVLA